MDNVLSVEVKVMVETSTTARVTQAGRGLFLHFLWKVLGQFEVCAIPTFRVLIFYILVASESVSVRPPFHENVFPNPDEGKTETRTTESRTLPVKPSTALLWVQGGVIESRRLSAFNQDIDRQD